jgi:predicted flap endonuclease-1-like 5' DNA nuclease
MAPIIDIEGIGTKYADKLRIAGVRTTAKLLERCAKASGRRAFAGQTGIEEGLILKWTNLADLMRISGVGPEYAELLEAAGVDTVKELRRRNAPSLAQAMLEINARRKLVRQAPGEGRCAAWIAHAKQLEPLVTH